MIYVWRRYGKPDPSMLATGCSRPRRDHCACAFVQRALGCYHRRYCGGVLVCVAVVFIERNLTSMTSRCELCARCLRPLGSSVVGLLADGTYGDGNERVAGGVRGLFYGDASQLWAQLIGITTTIVWVD